MLFHFLTARGSHAKAAIVAACGVLVAVLTAATWYGWLGWDHEYQIDPVTGIASGPYESWQVIGCALTLIGLALVAGLLVHPLLPLVVMPLAFTVAWSIDASGTDESGLWGVGAILILFGTLAGAGVLTGLTALILRGLGMRTA